MTTPLTTPHATPSKKNAAPDNDAIIAGISLLLQNFTQQSATPLEHPTKLAFTVEQCLTPDECTALINLSHTKGYQPALLNAGAAQILATDTRKSERCMIDDKALAAALYARIEHLIPTTLTNPYNKKVFQPVGLNERLRFLKYNVGDYFVQHMDGTYVRPMGHPQYGERSMLTYLVYLNEDFDGGALAMEWQGDDSKKGQKGQRRGHVVHHIQPKCGEVVVHDHQILHEAMVVTKGTRYCIRTDVMFAPMKASMDDGDAKNDK